MSSDLEDTIQHLRDRVARLEAQLDAQQVRAARAVSEVHRSYRRELVLWTAPTQAVARRGTSHTPLT